MSCLKGRKADISREEHLQRAHFKNYYEMKRFVEEQKILHKDHRRAMVLINKEIQEVQKTLMDIKLISGYCHQDYAAHLKSVSIVFSTFKGSRRVKNLDNMDMNVECNPTKSKLKFCLRHESLKESLCDKATADCKGDPSIFEQQTQTLDTSAKTYKKYSSTGAYLKSKTCIPSKELKNGLDQNNIDDYFKASLSDFANLESSSTKCNGDGFGLPQKTSQASPKRTSCNTQTDLTNSISPTQFALHKRATQVHQIQQQVDYHKCPTHVMMNPLSEQEGFCCHLNIQKQNQERKTLSRYLHNNKNNGRNHISKASIKHTIDLLIKENNHSQNLELLNKEKQRMDLQDQMSNFVSELSEFKC